MPTSVAPALPRWIWPAWPPAALTVHFEIALKPWDFAAGELIAREAGAIVCDFTGGHNYMLTGNIVAGNPRVVKAMLANMREQLSDALEALIFTDVSRKPRLPFFMSFYHVEDLANHRITANTEHRQAAK